ncbi:SDR family oxidoreductase [Nocardia sp. NPDC049707]|uniref:SDR family oxidoreductase n=1 Tax=Nocardia sp. NPDC049707 TaxID=3154735 RepID=UPI0034256089
MRSWPVIARPPTIMAAANGALASLASGLAIEMAPVRVNVISPGWVDTPIWDQLEMDKQAAFAELSQRLPARRIGTLTTSPRRSWR